MTHHDKLPPGVSIEDLFQEFRPREVSHARTCTPQDVIRLSRDNLIVRACLDGWEHGYFATWEQAMTACVCYLANQNNQLIQHAVMPEINSERTTL